MRRIVTGRELYVIIPRAMATRTLLAQLNLHVVDIFFLLKTI